MSKSDRIDFYFRCQVVADSKKGVLLDYWQSEDTELPLREMILSAGLAYWLPFAYKRLGSLSTNELKQVVRSSIYQLQLHIIYLKNSFDFEDESYVLEATGLSNDLNLSSRREHVVDATLPQRSLHKEEATSSPSPSINYIDDTRYDESDEFVRKMSSKRS